MAPPQHPRSYFLAPSDNIAPETTIRLGQLIGDVRRPDVRINEPEVIPGSQVTNDAKYNWKWTHCGDRTGEISLSGSILAMFLGAGPELGVGRSSKQITEYSASILETKHFNPDSRYLMESMNAAAVLDYLEEHRGASLYMVTGVKVARNPSMRQRANTEFKGKLGMSWDTSAVGVPLSGEASAGFGSDTADGVSYSASTDLVLAVKINKVVTRWGYATGRTKEMLRGTVLDDGSSRLDGLDVENVSEAEDGRGEEVLLDFELQEEDFTGDDQEDSAANMKYKEYVDDDERQCILVTIESN